MLVNERYEVIKKIIKERGSIKNSELVTMLGVSIETVRRDIENLAQQNVLTKVHGGAILQKQNEMADFSPFSTREGKNIEYKKEIAEYVLKYIQDGDTIALNNGTTNYQIAKALKGKFKHLTVITNSLRITTELSQDPGITIILAGGVYNKVEYAFLGKITEKFFDNFFVDKAFINVGGISLKRGVTDSLVEEVQIEKKLMQIADKVYYVADSTKIDSNALIKLCDLNEGDDIFTDSSLTENIKKLFMKKGINIINQ